MQGHEGPYCRLPCPAARRILTVLRPCCCSGLAAGCRATRTVQAQPQQDSSQPPRPARRCWREARSEPAAHSFSARTPTVRSGSVRQPARFPAWQAVLCSRDSQRMAPSFAVLVQVRVRTQACIKFTGITWDDHLAATAGSGPHSVSRGSSSNAVVPGYSDAAGTVPRTGAGGCSGT